MICIDATIDWGHRLGPSCHLISDLEGEAGQRELREFAAKIGLRLSWIQYPGTYKEHLDLFGRRIEAALSNGATRIDRMRFVNILRKKRGLAPMVLGKREQAAEAGLAEVER